MTSAPPIIVDTHCHLDYLARQASEENFSEQGFPAGDPASAFARAQAEGVSFIVNPTVSPANYEAVKAVAEALEHVYMAIAIHPTDVHETRNFPDWLERAKALLKHPKTVAIGETGLDYYWSIEDIALQKSCLNTFLKLGVEYDLPVILHDRTSQADNPETCHLNSHEDLYQAVKAVSGVRGIMHCFSGDAEFARRMIELGFYISFAGNLTFKKATELHEAARVTPLEWMLVETDTPFLSPVPFRGKPNEPARVRYVVEKIAELKGLTYEEVARVTTENARRVFGL